MTMRVWYLGRVIPWVALLGLCSIAVLAAVSLHQWPQNAWSVMPLVLGGCAAACCFVFDDAATAITSVTPRGSTWGRTTRLGAGLVPVAVWTLLVASAPSGLLLDRSAWLLAGSAAALVATGAAAIAARRQRPRPGPAVAGVVMMLVLAPLIAGPFLQWESVYPFGDFAGWVTGLWTGVAVVGALLVALALRR